MVREREDNNISNSILNAFYNFYSIKSKDSIKKDTKSSSRKNKYTIYNIYSYLYDKINTKQHYCPQQAMNSE